MCESESGFGFESGFKTFLAGFGFKKIKMDSDSCGFGFETGGFGSGFGFEMPGFAHHWYVQFKVISLECIASTLRFTWNFKRVLILLSGCSFSSSLFLYTFKDVYCLCNSYDVSQFTDLQITTLRRSGNSRCNACHMT